MKKIFYLIIALLVTCVTWSYSFAESSGELTGDARITSGRAILRGIIVMTDVTNDATISVYASNEASGKKLMPTWVINGASDTGGHGIFFPERVIESANGIYVDVTTSGTVSYVVYYDKME